MDLLSDVLAVTRIGSVSIAQAELLSPWGLEVDPIAEAHIHIVQEGHCWLKTSVELEHRLLSEGDVVFIRSGIGHSISDEPNTKIEPYKKVLDEMPGRLAAALSRGTSASSKESLRKTKVFCAKYLFAEHSFHPLNALLPPLIHIRAEETSSSIQSLLALLRQEFHQPDGVSKSLIPSLVDSLLVYVIREGLEHQSAKSGGWFSALREPVLVKALSLIHESPQHSWSIDELAQRLGQSRSAFSRKFSSLVGESPGAYLTRWRLCIASKLLVDSELSLGELAAKVGYESAPAFSKAFKRVHGCAPGQFRESQRRELER